MRKARIATASLLTFALTFGSMLSAAFGAVPKDAEKHWASATLTKWTESGLLKGYEDGTVKPDAAVTRGEFAALLNRAFELKEEAADAAFADLPKSNWAYHDIAVALKAGYIQGNGNGGAAPNAKTTREEAAVMVAKALQWKGDAGADPISFKDAAQISEWSQGAISELAAANVVKGDMQGNFRPKASITRAEAVVLLDAALGLKNAAKVFDQAGEYGSDDRTQTIAGDVVISASGVTLTNMVIAGNLTIAKEVGDGDVTLKKVTVKGTTNVNGGGANSVHVEDSVLLRIIVDKPSGTVRIVAISATTVQDVIVNSAVKLEESNTTDSGFTNVELSKALPKDSGVELVGQFEDVRVLAANIQINVPSGSIGNLSVAEGADNSTINLSKEAQVLKLVLDSVAKLIGEGKIENATVNEGAKGSSFETKPNAVDGSGKDTGSTPTGSTSPGGSNPPGTTDPGTPSPGNGNNECTENCADATLHSLSVASSVYMELEQRDGGNLLLGTGYSPDVMSYSVAIPADFTESDVTLSVSSAVYSSVRYTVQTDDGNYSWGSLENGATEFSVRLQPHHDLHVYLYVYSADGVRSKQYQVHFYYERSLQEAFRLRNAGNGPEVTVYQLETGSLEKGDRVTITVPAADTTLGSEISVTETVYYPNASFNLDDWGRGNHFSPSSLQGALHVVVERAGQTVMDGDYQYDLTPITVIENQAGLSVELLTKEELLEEDATSNSESRHSFQLRINLNKETADPSLRNAQYIEIKSTDKYYTDTQPRLWTKEDLKNVQNQFTGMFWPIKLYEGGNEHGFLGYKELYNQYLYVFYYDAQKNPIGYFLYDLNFDYDHVGKDVKLMPSKTRE
ncbi:S-layer homology domain-containing protein [Cohnella thailandensis]|uniref:S-layer homology domain-containing protein n=1 Tax=Cohnella thailandensis TaxID=557557 RepID=A0A841SZQ2_9BACL|nr:S-layer homology domain-containing protein [Cohnella thailandensis]MBB6637384.1 S-layer homology domain-containing protein [Cohnella thailandensis]MBP1976713.1 hypothetical protein [Cohnella thailandensis]